VQVNNLNLGQFQQQINHEVRSNYTKKTKKKDDRKDDLLMQLEAQRTSLFGQILDIIDAKNNRKQQIINMGLDSLTSKESSHKLTKTTKNQ